MDPLTHQKNLNSLLPGVAEQESAEFERRLATVAAFGQLACWMVNEQYGQDTAELYAETSWNYQELRRFSETERQDPPGTAPQVFARWYDLTSHQLDLLPIKFETAKKTRYDLGLLGAAVMAHVLKTPITSELLSDFHDHRLGRLLDKPSSSA